jgi:formylglycine-generating enzyme
MNEHPRQVLFQLVKQHGKTVAEDGRLCKSLLNDVLQNQHRKEMNVLVHAIEAKVVCDLLTLTSTLPLQVLIGRLVQKLRDEKGTGEMEARWAVESWLLAFELVTDEEIAQTETVHGRSKTKVPDGGQAISTSKTQRKPGEIITNSVGMKFAWIHAGTFLMGSPKNEANRSGDDDETRHKVTLTKGFFMGVHLVTQEQWQAVMGNNPSNFKGEKNLPVERVSWEDCQEFIKKLRDIDKKAYRLPSEAEWEYACRAGTTTPYCFGATISTDQANYDGIHIYGNGKKGVDRQKTTPVGRFPANAWGLFDTHGNLWEWCQDWLGGDYPQNDVVDPQGPNEGQCRVLRGGSLIDDHRSCRSAFRYGSLPGIGLSFGLRVCFCLD